MKKDRCKYELHVEKYFGLPALFPQEQKISVAYATLCDLLVSFEQQETSALRAENERLRGLINDLLVKIPMDNGNAYLSGFNESLDKLNNELNNL